MRRTTNDVAHWGDQLNLKRILFNALPRQRIFLPTSRIDNRKKTWIMYSFYKSILVLLTFGLLNVFQSNAAVVYTDITNGTPAGLDFNGDGNNDFEITNMNGTGDYLTYWANDGDNVVALGNLAAGGWDVAQWLNANTAIDAASNWQGQGDCAITGWGGTTNFPFNVDTYLGVRMVFGGNTHYGWVLVEATGTAANPTITYKEFAYNDTPNGAIAAGDTGAGGGTGGGTGGGGTGGGGVAIAVTAINVQGQGGISTITSLGGTLQMVANVSPTNATNSTVTWSVVNLTGLGTISNNGVLTGYLNGEVEVVATANDGSGVQGSRVITISDNSNNNPVEVSSIEVTSETGNYTIKRKGGILRMLAEVLPANANVKSVTWSINNLTGSATINSNGFVIAKENGTVEVVATANDGSGIIGKKELTIEYGIQTSVEELLTEQIQVYPNPVVSNFDILIPEEFSNQFEVYVLNALGQTVHTARFENQTQVTVEASYLPRGFYTVLVDFQTEKVVKKIVVR